MDEENLVGVPRAGAARVEIKFEEDGSNSVWVIARTFPTLAEKSQAQAIASALVGAGTCCGCLVQEVPVRRRPAVGALEAGIKIPQVPDPMPCSVQLLAVLVPKVLEAWGWHVTLECVCPRLEDPTVKCLNHRAGGGHAKRENIH